MHGFDRRLGPRSRRSRESITEPHDRLQGQWPRDKLEDMDARFITQMERAFALGLENRASGCVYAAREVFHSTTERLVKLTS